MGVPTATPAVTVVTPAFNSAETLAATVESLQAQSLNCWTLRLFDNGSSDNTAAIGRQFAAEDPRVEFVAEAVNVGPAPLRNRGAMAATSRYVQFLDADDLLHPDFYAEMVPRLDETGAEVAHCHVEYLDDSGEVGVKDGAPNGGVITRPDPPYTGPALCEPPEMVRYFYPFTPMFAGATLFSTDAFKRFGGFSEDPAWITMQDQDLVLRMAAHCTFAYVDRRLVTVRVAANSTSRATHRRRQMREGLVAMTEAALEREQVEELGVEADLRRMLGRYRADLARWQAYESVVSARESVQGFRDASKLGEPWAKLALTRVWETVRGRPHGG